MRCDAPDVPLLERSGGLAARLAVHERNAIRRASQVECCGAGDVLQQANTRSRCAIIPITAVLSIVRPLSETLSELISRGAIARERDTIFIRRDVLEVAACECYESVRIGNGADSR